LSISFKEFQPKRSKQPKKRISEASQENIELPQPLPDRGVQLSSNQPQPKVVQPPHDNSIKKNPDAQAVPPRVEVEQKEGRDECIKRIVCFRCGERGHYANRCPTKRKKMDTLPVGVRKRMMINPRATLAQTSSVNLLAKQDDQDTSAGQECHPSVMSNSHVTSSSQDTKVRKACFHSASHA